MTGRTDDGSWLQIITTEGEVAWVFTAAVLTRSGTIEQLPIVVPPAVESTP
ncbi:MAG: hypothetical protein R2932_38005 [Caldilineaceae bacterium]